MLDNSGKPNLSSLLLLWRFNLFNFQLYFTKNILIIMFNILLLFNCMLVLTYTCFILRSAYDLLMPENEWEIIRCKGDIVNLFIWFFGVSKRVVKWFCRTMYGSGTVIGNWKIGNFKGTLFSYKWQWTRDVVLILHSLIVNRTNIMIITKQLPIISPKQNL